ncbi:MAG: DUF1326 domain-containing protein [Terriglobia bacterium]
MAVVAGAAWPATTLASPHWEIRGAMSEACTCQVPCGCNFGQGPSPHHYCWSLASFDIKRGHYGGVSLGGQHLVRAHGGASTVWYVEESATTAQFDALQAIATRISGYARAGGPGLRFERARITQVAGDRGTSLQIGSKGGFDSDYIIGMDGKTPIVVENMQAWNVQHDIKAKAKRLYYKDQYGNQFDMAGTNSNQGKFDWTDKTPHYF